MQYICQTITNSSISHLIFLQMQRKVVKTIAKICYMMLCHQLSFLFLVNIIDLSESLMTVQFLLSNTTS